LICTAAVAAFVCLQPLGPVILTIALLLYSLTIATGDLIALFNGPTFNPKTDDEYYSQFEPKSKMAILLAFVAFALYVIGWSVGAFAEPGKRPLSTILIADIVFTVVGMAFCLYARMRSQTYIQTAITWIPLCCWLLHSIILLGHGVQIDRVSAG
jgi:hypothetical protein